MGKFNSLDPLAYQGVRAQTPPNMNIRSKDPTANEIDEYHMGEFWLQTVSQGLFILTSKVAGVPTWTKLATVTGDGLTGIKDNAGNIATKDADMAVSLKNGSYVSIERTGVSEITITASIFAGLIADDALTAVIDGDRKLTLAGGNYITTSVTAANEVTLDFDLAFPLIVANGGTGLTTLTANSLLAGNGTSDVTLLGVGTTGQVLKSQGAGVDPIFSNAVFPVSINEQTGTSYTFVLSDAGKLVTLTNAAAIALTIPTNASVAFPDGTQILICQGGAGKVTVGGVGITLKGASAFNSLVEENSGGELIKVSGDTWRLWGDIE